MELTPLWTLKKVMNMELWAKVEGNVRLEST